MRRVTRPPTACCTMAMYISFLISEPKVGSTVVDHIRYIMLQGGLKLDKK